MELKIKDIHKHKGGKLYKVHDTNLFQMTKVFNEYSFVESFGYYKEHGVLRIKIRGGNTYQYSFVPLWVFYKIIRANHRDHVGYVFRNWILKKYPYINEEKNKQEVEQLIIKFEI